MAPKNRSIVFLLACILICDSYKLEDILIKCHLKDDVCQLKLFGALLSAVESGVVDLGVKPIDPLSMSDISGNVLGMVDFTLVNATTTGVKNCEIVSLTTHIERKLAKKHIVCNIKMEGIFKVSSCSPVIEKLFGGSINGQGEGTLLLNDLNIFFVFHYNARKGEDGENYLDSHSKEIEYKYVYSGKTELIADLIPDNQDANDFILNFLNENSSFIKASIGSAYVARILELYHDFADKFFGTVPAKKYILDDLTPFLKN